MKELLEKLSNTAAVSGREDAVKQIVKEELEDEVDSLEEDGYGNLIARKGSGEPTLLVDAHVDQIGLAVRRITDDGFIYVSRVGGLYPQNVVSRRVKIHATRGENVKGVISQKPKHLMTEEERRELPEVGELFVDLGVESREEVEELGIRRGDRLTFDTEFESLENDYVTGQAMDDRAGVAVQIELMKQADPELELVGVFSVREEVGAKGAGRAAYGVNPDAAIAVDVAHAGDIPNVKSHESDLEMGGGPMIELLQSNGTGMIAPERIDDWLTETAEDQGIPAQRMFYEGGITDGKEIELARDGVPTGSVKIPVRNMHSDIEVIKMSDLQETLELLEESVYTLEQYL